MTKTIIKTTFVGFVAVLMMLGATTASAATDWDVTGTYVWDVFGTYFHDITIDVQNLDGSFSGTGSWPSGGPEQTGEIVTGTVSGDDISFTVTYTGPYGIGSVFNMIGTIDGNGHISGTSPWDWQFTGGSATFMRYAEILTPETDEIVYGDVDLTAVLYDKDENDNVQWAVREGTCAAGTNTVAGNVDTYNDDYSWNGTDFSTVWDSTGAIPGMYCFIFNPTETAGDLPVRETREFYVAGSYINGGGQILEELSLPEGAKKNAKPEILKISFGGWVADIGNLVGEVQINFHNVGDDEFDGGKFHSTDIVSLTVASGNPSCDAAMNYVAQGSYNGEEEWSVVVRASDNDDTFRVQLFRGLINSPLLAGHEYDTHAEGEFTDNSDCYGTARTELDNGNITIVDNS